MYKEKRDAIYQPRKANGYQSQQILPHVSQKEASILDTMTLGFLKKTVRQEMGVV
jgi:hypothetical protein